MYAAGVLGVTQGEMLGAVEAVYEELMDGAGGRNLSHSITPLAARKPSSLLSVIADKHLM